MTAKPTWQAACGVCALLLLWPAPLSAQDIDRSRDEDIFGSPPAEAPVSDEPERDEDALFSTAATDTPPPHQEAPEAERLDALVAQREDTMAIGGLYYLRATYLKDRDTAAGEAPLRSPSFFDMYADARPVERVRVYARGRLRYDFTVDESAGTLTDPTQTVFTELGGAAEKADAALDQLWLKFDIERTVYVTAGKQPLKWGTGRFWNPTDFLNPQRRDPLAAFDERLGVSLVKFHLPFEASGSNLYFIVDLEDAAAPEEVGAAVRGEAILGAAEVAAMGEVRKDRASIVGADFSLGLWDFDLRGEAAFVNGDEGPFYTGSFDPTRLKVPRERDRKSAWIPQVVAGLEYAFNYSDEDSMALGAEYFYNGSGYHDADFYPWLLFNNAFRPLYLGRHYAGAYAFLAGPGGWNDTTIIGSVLGNLSDRSYLGRLDYRVNVLRYVNIDTFVNYHFGRSGEFNFGLRIPPVPAVPQLAMGLRSAQPLVDAGVGLRVSF